MELTIDRLEFDVDKEPRRYIIINNLHEYGLTMERVFTDWINNCADITPESLCKFIRARNKNIVCFTEDEYSEWAHGTKSAAVIDDL